MMRYKNFTIAVFILLTHLAIGQDFTKEDIKEIQYKVDSVLLCYEKYGKFTRDDKNISGYYIEKFKELFQNPTSGTYIINDIEDKSILDDKIGLDEYIRMVKMFWKTRGLGVSISDKSYFNPEFEGNNNYLIKVKLNKRVYGFFRNEDYYDKTFSLIFLISFKERNDGYVDFKIREITTEDLLASQKPKKDYKLKVKQKIVVYIDNEFGVNISPFYSNIYIMENINTKVRAGVGFSISYISYYPNSKVNNNHLGSGIGIGISNFSSVLKKDEFTNPEYNCKDIDKDDYILRSQLKELEDLVNLTLFDLDIYLLKYKNVRVNSKLGLFANIQFNISFPIGKTYTISGIQTSKGYYEKYNCELFNVPPYGFVTDKSFRYTGDVGINPIIFSGSVNAGIVMKLIKNINVEIGILYRRSAVRISEDKYTDRIVTREDSSKNNFYNSMLELSEEAIINSIGVSGSIKFNF